MPTTTKPKSKRKSSIKFITFGSLLDGDSFRFKDSTVVYKYFGNGFYGLPDTESPYFIHADSRESHKVEKLT